jgi:hypothetical protein
MVGNIFLSGAVALMAMHTLVAAQVQPVKVTLGITRTVCMRVRRQTPLSLQLPRKRLLKVPPTPLLMELRLSMEKTLRFLTPKCIQAVQAVAEMENVGNEALAVHQVLTVLMGKFHTPVDNMKSTKDKAKKGVRGCAMPNHGAWDSCTNIQWVGRRSLISERGLASS